MTNIEKYQTVMIESFNIDNKQLSNLTYQGIPEWDSVGHMNLIAAIEETFDVMLETDDIVEFSSYIKGIEILKKYEIEF